MTSKRLGRDGRRPWLVVALAAAVMPACSTTEETSGTGGSGGAGGSSAAVCTEPTLVPCEDQVILEMNLQTVAAPGLISSVADGAGFTTSVDATAGGAFATTPHSYVYGRFTETGLQKVDISDEESLTSMDWDIAFRRYVIRINSGHSGPSCVTAARVPPASGPYDAIATVPDGLTFRADEYFTASCELIADGTGLPGSPATALASYWTYPGCVQMTFNAYVVELASGRHLKLTVDRYYNEASQQQCQDTDSVPQTGSDAANPVLRWAFLP